MWGGGGGGGGGGQSSVVRRVREGRGGKVGRECSSLYLFYKYRVLKRILV